MPRDRLARLRLDLGPDGLTSVEARQLLGSHEYWQDRADVRAEDIAREGVTVGKLAAWLRANGWALQPHDGSSWDGWSKGKEWIDVPRNHFDVPQIAAVIRRLASVAGRSQWDVLAEIAEARADG